MTGYVLAVERAYVAAATGGAAGAGDHDAPMAFAAAAAVAARFLAIGTPRSLAVIGAGPAAVACVRAHATWFAPRELRCTDADVAAALADTGAEVRVVPRAQALAADIVCVLDGEVAATDIRSGTHLSLAPGATVDAALRARAMWVDEPELARTAAGLVDGRQLDEITVFVAADLAIARGAAESP